MPATPDASDRRFILALIGTGLLLVGVAITAFRSDQAAGKANIWREHTREVLLALEALQNSLLDVETGSRGYVLSGDEDYLVPYESGRMAVASQLETVKRLTSDNPEQQATLRELEPVIWNKVPRSRALVDLRRNQGFEAAQRLFIDGVGRVQMDSIRAAIEKMKQEEGRLYAERDAQAKEDERWTAILTIAGVTVALVMVSVTSLLMIRSASALRRSLHAIQEQEWLQSSLGKLVTVLREEQEATAMGQKALAQVAGLLSSAVGALSWCGQDQRFTLLAGYALGGTARQPFASGEGLAGEAVRSRRLIQVSDVPSGHLPVSSTVAAGATGQVVAVPLIYRDRVEGVLELGGFQPWSAIQIAFLERAGESIAIALASTRSLMQIKELLRVSQTQEEELRVQQEELTQTNEELEQQARLLATRNEEVEEANRGIATASRELEQKAEQLALTSRYKSEFLSNMSHELRTPLNSLLILSRELYENAPGNLTDKQVRYATTIHSAGGDLLNLINDILDLAKIESGTVELDVTEVTFADINDAIEQTMRPLAAQKGLQFSVVLGAALPRSFASDGKRVQQVLKNLLSNAFKFTPVGAGRPGRVTLSIDVVRSGWNGGNPRLAQGAIAFAVTDTGIGIPADKQRIIFEAFQQADGGVSRKYGGTGLGLSISRELTHLLGGELSLVSTPGEGSTFTLYLPLGGEPQTAPVESPRPPMTRQPTPAEVSATVDPAPGVADDRGAISAGDRVALIVEDDHAFASILIDLARERGFKAIACGVGGAVLGLARTLKPDAITLDIHLADGNGWHLLDRLKHDRDTRHIPVHVITIDDERPRALRQGAHGVLTKPASREALAQVFADLFSFGKRQIRRLLVVEDNPIESRAIVETIGNGDVVTTAVADGDAALAALASERFDCIVLDLGLPGMSGQNLLDALHANPAWRDIPVIVYTARDLTPRDELQLRRSAKTIVLKTANSLDRLLDETALFLHRVHDRLPAAKRERIERMGQSDPSLVGRTVLVADDDMRNIFALTSLLERHGMVVVSAENGREALQRLKDQPDISVVLMDVMMPEMDGLTAMRAIRAVAAWKDLPVIALTAKAMKGDREQCLSAGASDYIAKPVDSDQLLSMLRVWLYR